MFTKSPESEIAILALAVAIELSIAELTAQREPGSADPARGLPAQGTLDAGKT